MDVIIYDYCDILTYVFLACYMTKKSVYYVIGGPYVSDQAGLNRGPLILNVFHCYFVQTFCEDRINTFLILILSDFILGYMP